MTPPSAAGERPILVVAVGGNALTPTTLPLAAQDVAGLATSHRVVVTHGNGPQVGALARQSEASGEGALPLDVLDAESVGLIGYHLANAIGGRVGHEHVVAVVTRVVVDPSDPAFGRPSKPIGPPGARLRVVASPEPTRVLELSSIRTLVEGGVVVVCGGGGGIPVADDGDGFHGVEAVVDKDLTSELIATELGASGLLVLTDVDAVYDGWGTDAAAPVRVATPERLRGGSWEAGSMGPKVEAACRFVEHTGHPAHIGALGAAADVLAGRAGTCVRVAG